MGWTRRHWPTTGKEEQGADGGDDKRCPIRANAVVGAVVDAGHVEEVTYVVRKDTERKISPLSN